MYILYYCATDTINIHIIDGFDNKIREYKLKLIQMIDK